MHKNRNNLRYEKRIQELESDVRVLKTIISEECLDDYNFIIKENEKLKDENIKMKAFLEDYGLKWLNNDVKEGEFKLKSLIDDLNLAKDDVMFNWNTKTMNLLNLDVITDKVEMLNARFLRGFRPISMKDKENGPDIIKLKFYKNGLKVGTLKYFSYVSRDAHNLLRDIINGFLPTFLKNIYPEGSLMKVVNKTYKTYEFADAKVMALNKGPVYSTYGPLADSEDDMEKDLEIEKEKKRKEIEEKKAEKRKIEAEKKVREEAKAKARKTIKVKTPFENLIKVSKSAAKQVATLKIRTVTLKTQLIIKLSKTDPVKKLFEWVDKFRDDNDDREYELHTVFPISEIRRTDTRSLGELGLYPERALSMHYVSEED